DQFPHVVRRRRPLPVHPPLRPSGRPVRLSSSRPPRPLTQGTEDNVTSARSLTLLLFEVSLALSGCDNKTQAPAPAATESGAQKAAAPAAKPGSVLASWGGGEQAAFQKVLDGFTAKTGIKVQYEQARDAQLMATLRTRVASKNPPSVAILPRPGFMADMARE